MSEPKIASIRLDTQNAMTVGVAGVTAIESTTKPGMHCDIPYVSVYVGDLLVAEFCQHNIIGVFYETVS